MPADEPGPGRPVAPRAGSGATAPDAGSGAGSGATGAPADPTGPAGGPAAEPAAGQDRLAWRVSRGMVGLKAGGALVFTLLAVFSAGEPVRLVVAGLAALVLAGYALRDLVAPVRLAADLDGVTVIAGYAGRRRLAWSQIERVRVDQRQRLGTRSELLEIDTGDSFHLLSAYDLGQPCVEVADALARLRTGGGEPARTADGPDGG